MKKITVNLLTLLVFCILWELLSHQYPSFRFIMPSPYDVGNSMWENKSSFTVHAFETLKEMSGGLLVAFIVAFPIAWLMTANDTLRSVLEPLFVVTQCVPIIALAPIMVFWFGWTYTAIIIPTALMVFFPLTMNIYEGLKSVPKRQIEYFRLHNATPWQLFYKLQLPFATPFIFTGLRIGMAYAGVGAVAGEWAGGQKGLGILMLESRRAADMGMMFGAVTCITLLSLAFYGLAALCEGLFKRGPSTRLFSSVLSTACLACVLTTGCQPASQSSFVGETTLVLDWLPNPNHVPLYVGIDKGFFEEQGINLKILKVAEASDNIPYLISGQCNLCLSYLSSTLLSLNTDLPVVPVGVLIDQPLNAFIYRLDSGIKSMEDINGKVVGYCVDGYQTRYLNAILSTRAIVPQKLCNASFDLVGMLATKEVDAIFGAYWNIEGENLHEHGIETSYISLSEFGVPVHYELLFLAKEGTEESSPSFAKSFQTAIQKSIDYSIQHPDEAFALYLKSNTDKSAFTKRWERNAWEKTLSVLAKKQEIDQNMWDSYVQWLVSKELLSHHGSIFEK